MNPRESTWQGETGRIDPFGHVRTNPVGGQRGGGDEGGDRVERRAQFCSLKLR